MTPSTERLTNTTQEELLPYCQRCQGAGSIDWMSNDGPDAYEYSVDCPACAGTGEGRTPPAEPS
jgi:DnaJ-class molecular chaperone